MNKEQIIDEAYDNYRTKVKLSQIPTDLTKEEFVELCKNDITFSVYWGLKLEERELSLDERMKIWQNQQDGRGHFIMELLDNIPTKLITLTHNNETIESYE